MKVEKKNRKKTEDNVSSTLAIRSETAKCSLSMSRGYVQGVRESSRGADLDESIIFERTSSHLRSYFPT